MLAESIKQKGLLEPLVIKDDDTIISGHRRWLALKALGMKAQCGVMSFVDELEERKISKKMS
ncbi:MAG TPA: ParB N-terminal domain-containing protein [Methanosarcina sp.]